MLFPRGCGSSVVYHIDSVESTSKFVELIGLTAWRIYHIDSVESTSKWLRAVTDGDGGYTILTLWSQLQNEVSEFALVDFCIPY